MERLIVAKSPHTSSKNNVRRIMLDVCIALLPALVAAIVFFGFRALLLTVVSVATCMVVEFLFDLCFVKDWSKGWWKKLSIWDCSCLVTGMLIAFNVPAALPVWMVMLGDVFAVVIVKMLFGGIGKNFMNPAMAARVFLFISFASAMATPTPVIEAFSGSTVYSSATWLGSSATIGTSGLPIPQRSAYWAGNEWLNMFLGCSASAAMGETSALALLLGFIYLSVRKVIDFRYPLMIVGSAVVFAFLFDAIPNGENGAQMFNIVIGHVLSGGLLLGAIFMATDYSTSPITFKGNVIYCVAIGLLVIVIRVFSGYPEGMSFAILLMNIVSPLIDKYCYPKPFGYVKPPRRKKVKTAKNKQKSEEASV